MKVGKVSETVLKRSILKKIGHRRPEVFLRPGVGEDCCGVALEPGEAVVLSTDPITGAAAAAGTLAVHITANDIASSGARLVGILLSIILPEETTEAELKGLMQEVEAACEELGAEVLGGHTEVSAAVNQPILTVTGVGKVKREEIITTAGLSPGQKLVMTKWAGLEGTAILARDRREQLLSRYTESFLCGAGNLLEQISVVKEAALAKEAGASAMHDITEGGVFGALWEMACASQVGLDVDLKRIPIKQETVEICEFFDVNPYQLISSGCLLIGTDDGEGLAALLQREGIPAAVIGRVCAGNDKIIRNGEETRYLEPPKSDELYRALSFGTQSIERGE